MRWSSSRCPASRKGDLGPAARHFRFDSPPHGSRLHVHPVAVRAGPELRNQTLRLADLGSRRLGGAPDLLVGRALGLRPRLVQMSDQQHDAIDLTVDVGSPLGGRAELRTIRSDHGFEVPDDLLGLTKMMLDSRTRLVGCKVTCPDHRGPPE